MNLKPHTRNVTRIFREATEAELSAGREWYARASRLAAELAVSLPTRHAYHGDLSRAAAVIAVISPRLSWPQNVKIARNLYHLAFVHASEGDFVFYGRGALPANIRKAYRLLTTDAPTDAIVSGPKVTAFWRTISDPNDPRAVVVDRHAIDVAVGRVTDDATRGKVLGRKGAYEVVALTYTRAARILSAELGEPITPAEVQAVTWTVWRNSHAAANHGQA